MTCSCQFNMPNDARIRHTSFSLLLVVTNYWFSLCCSNCRSCL
jgi:hypothetical protein